MLPSRVALYRLLENVKCHFRSVRVGNVVIELILSSLKADALWSMM